MRTREEIEVMLKQLNEESKSWAKEASMPPQLYDVETAKLQLLMIGKMSRVLRWVLGEEETIW